MGKINGKNLPLNWTSCFVSGDGIASHKSQVYVIIIDFDWSRISKDFPLHKLCLHFKNVLLPSLVYGGNILWSLYISVHLPHLLIWYTVDLMKTNTLETLDPSSLLQQLSFYSNTLKILHLNSG